MKTKTFIIWLCAIVAIFTFLFTIDAPAADLIKETTPTIKWAQDQKSLQIPIIQWELAMAEGTIDGVKETQLVIPRPADVTGSDPLQLSGKYTITITGQIGKTYKYYFFIRAVCLTGDPPNQAPLYSEWSDVGIVVSKDGTETDYLEVKFVPGKPFTLRIEFVQKAQ